MRNAKLTDQPTIIHTQTNSHTNGERMKCRERRRQREKPYSPFLAIIVSSMIDWVYVEWCVRVLRTETGFAHWEHRPYILDIFSYRSEIRSINRNPCQLWLTFQLFGIRFGVVGQSWGVIKWHQSPSFPNSPIHLKELIWSEFSRTTSPPIVVDFCSYCIKLRKSPSPLNFMFTGRKRIHKIFSELVNRATHSQTSSFSILIASRKKRQTRAIAVCSSI